MAFDPTLPAQGAPNSSAVVRGQFNALKELIDAGVPGPAGPQGAQGIQGPQGPQGPEGVQGLTGADGPGGAAGPQGPEGAQGATGSTGADGPGGAAGPQGERGSPGEAGPQGPPFANAVVDGVTTLPPETSATVTVSFDGANVRMSFGIPAGVPGATGPQGEPGPQGPSGGDGPAGPPGEVSQATLDAAIAGTARNPAQVAPFGIPLSDPPTAAEVQQVIDKLNELIAATAR